MELSEEELAVVIASIDMKIEGEKKKAKEMERQAKRGGR